MRRFGAGAPSSVSLRNRLRGRRARPGDRWHLGEVFLTIDGGLWRAVDQDGVVLGVLVLSPAIR
ncbi:hypothetical protein [Rhodococcus sp. NPDC057529]|uniref:hypothetical protein n=1 Tax=Rhodococcus sp. NPDC057529 TaxID=3346158 RepID=UPI00366B451E